ncbi:response regulator transcription factor [Alkaliphilus peptidifermentans]|uniref:Stage 0 sporulation protein A homolog n=1 Tax=Alkaliphilus peptidifermentans DSM 18978 TaxID=1120976 RepID=A0A1G5CCY7_9FIRM|nr:response regulator transcription factor [Alkaliphilus peptidifermentans]SCY00207.1 DNA-binding response regulator, OmpR family, contains REC and winged-helix (wHTH) domain [Alkaliphilus peptidifermentans DSM 18978]
MNGILIVEDDKTIAMGIEYSLKQEGFETHICHNANDAIDIIERTDFLLIILDVSLPDGNGFDLCKIIREKGDTPVIFLTACDDEVNIVMGLDMGADDYIIKPFRVRELISRIKSILRRSNKKANSGEFINIGDISINTAAAKVYKKDKDILLTALEYKLLLTLANSEGKILSRNQILEGIWDVAGDFVNDNTLTVYIKRLREKIEDDPHNPQIIKTIRGLGYKVGE